MKAAIDSVGRVGVPKPLRDALGLQPGTEVEISRYGAGVQLVRSGRTAMSATLALDTSVAIPLLVQTHSDHGPWSAGGTVATLR